MELDRRKFVAGLGGSAVIAAMSSEAKADAIEDYMMEDLNQKVTLPPLPDKYPTMAEVEAQITTRPYRLGGGWTFLSLEGNVKKLPPMPAAPTLMDFFNRRFLRTGNHCLQSAKLALDSGAGEEVAMACLLHDVVQEIVRVDHGWWGAQMLEPYVSKRISWAIRYHQALRFFPDESVGYEYPNRYRQLFGEDYTPEPYIVRAYETARNHKWYMDARLVTINDYYAFDPNSRVDVSEFTDMIGRHFRQPKEGLGYDNTPVAHMWRSLIKPDSPL